MEDFFVALTWLGFFSAVFFSLYFYWQFRNRERMALIEKGVDISEIYKKRKNEFKFRFPWIRISFLIAGIGGGLLASFLIVNDPHFEKYGNVEEEVMISALLLLIGGSSLFVGHIIELYLNKLNDRLFKK